MPVLYKYYNDYSDNYDGRKKSYSTPWGRDVRKIFMPPDKIGDEAVENDGEIELPSFLNVLYGYILPHVLPLSDEYEDLRYQYRALADDNLYTLPRDEMLRWMGKTADDCRPLAPNEQLATAKPDKKIYFKKFVVTDEEFEDNVTSKDNRNTASEEFLREHGIKRNSDEEKVFRQLYMPEAKGLRGNSMTVAIEGEGHFSIVSCNVSNHKSRDTYYLLRLGVSA